MNSCSSKIILSFLFMIASYSYAIEGKWRVTHLDNYELPSNHSIEVQINDFIFRNATIRWSLSFEGCSQFKYQMQVEEDNLYINHQTFYSKPLQECSRQEQQLEGRMILLIKRSFRFQILSSFMVFNDFTGKVLMKFSRIFQPKTHNFQGNWRVSRVYAKAVSQLLQVRGSEMTLCQQKLKLTYELNSNNKIAFTSIKNDGCKADQLLKAIDQTRFYREQGSNLVLYSQSVKPIITLKFYKTVEEAESQMKEEEQRISQQERLKEERAQAKRLQILRNRQAERQKLLREREQAQLNEISKTISQLPENLEGKWKIYNVFGLPFFNQKLDLIITKDQIILSGGCNTHIMGYQITGNEVEVGSLRSTKKICSNDEDDLYKRGLEKIRFFQLNLINHEIVVVFEDENQKIVFEIKRNASTVTITSNEQQPSNPFQSTEKKQIVEKSKIEIKEGRYMMLLLMRRDLPRKLITINSDTLSFKICNRIKISLSGDQEKIKLTIDDKTEAQASCDLQREDAYLQNLEKVTKYKIQNSDVTLLDEEDKEIVHLDLVSS